MPDSRSLAWARFKDSRTSMQDAAVVALIAAVSLVRAGQSRSLCNWGVTQTRYAAVARAKASGTGYTDLCVVRRKAAVVIGGDCNQAAPFEASHRF